MDAPSTQCLNALQGGRGAVGEIVNYNDIITAIKQLDADMRANITGSSRNQDFHLMQSLNIQYPTDSTSIVGPAKGYMSES